MSDKNAWAGYESFAFERDFNLAKNSSIGVGGSARVAFTPQSIEEATTLIEKLTEDKIPFYAVGNMTNVLPADGVSKRAFVCMKRLKGIAQREHLFVEAGVTSGELFRACKKLEKSGAEFLEGIPCTLGGALYMNAGVQGAYIGEIVESVLAIKAGKIVELSQRECEYAYKTSVFMQGDYVILGASLRLENADLESINAKLKYYRDRRAHLPKGKSMGCVFKNPDGAVAGRLIEGAGLKGFRVGGASVSEAHANFVINDKNATSAQIKSLITIIKNAVFAQYKIRLQEEIRYLE